MPETQAPDPRYSNFTGTRNFDPMDDEISLLDLAITLAKHKKLILGLPLVVALVAGIVTLFMPKSYTATAKILPVGGKDISKDIYISLLKSQPVADSLVKRYKLQASWHVADAEDARDRLSAASKISLAKDGSIEIEVRDRNASQAAALANAYAGRLQELSDLLPVSEASRHRIALEKQLARSTQEQNVAEKELAEFKAQNGDVGVSSNVEEYVKTSNAIKAQIAAKEVELAFMRNGSDAMKNSSFIKLQQEINSLWADLGKVENGLLLKGNFSKPQLDYLHLVRDLSYAQANYLELKKQVELARIEELNNAADFQVLQKAEAPDRPSSPQRLKIIPIATLASAFLAVLWAFITEALQKAKQDPESSKQFQLLQRYLKWS